MRRSRVTSSTLSQYWEEVLEHRVHCLLQCGLGVGDMDHAQRLREVGVRRRTVEEAVRLIARVPDPRPKPGLATLTRPQDASPRDRCVGQWPPTVVVPLVAHVDLGEVVPGSTLVEPQLAGPVMCVRLADEGVPVDVADVSLHAGLDEPNRHDRHDLAVAIQVAALHEPVPRDQRAGSVHAPVRGLVGLLHLGQKPRREKEGGDA